MSRGVFRRYLSPPRARAWIGTAPAALATIHGRTASRRRRQLLPLLLGARPQPALLLGSLTVSAQGTVGGTGAVSGTLTATLGALTLSAAGTAGAGAITGKLRTSTRRYQLPLILNVRSEPVQLLEALTVSATGTVGAAGGVNGTLTQTLGALTVASAGSVAVTGTASRTLGALTSIAAGTVAPTGALARTLGALTITATGVLGTAPISGALSVTLGPLGRTLAGTVAVAGTATRTLGPLTVVSTGTVAIAGVLAKTLGPLTLSAHGVGPPPEFIEIVLVEFQAHPGRADFRGPEAVLTFFGPPMPAFRGPVATVELVGDIGEIEYSGVTVG